MSVWISRSHLLPGSLHLLTILCGTAVLVVLALWLLPVWQVAKSRGLTAANRFDRENEARKTLAQIIGGVLVLAGLYSSVKTFDLQRQTENVQEQTERSQEQGQINERFTKAIDQLGAVTAGKAVGEDGKPKINLEVRLGGIYALEQIAKDAPEKYHWTVMEVLTAYVRENARGPEKAGAGRDTRVQAGWQRSPRADIQAVLDVIGRRDITHDPPGKHLNLSAAHLEGANLNHAHLNGAHLVDAHFEGAHLTADLEGADLSGAYLDGARLYWADLKEANLSDADLNGAFLNGADLSGARLSGASLIKAHMNGSDLKGADLESAHLAGADLFMADLQGAELEGAYLRGVDLSSVRNLTDAQLIGTAGSKSSTKLPPGVHPPPTWGP